MCLALLRVHLLVHIDSELLEFRNCPIDSFAILVIAQKFHFSKEFDNITASSFCLHTF